MQDRPAGCQSWFESQAKQKISKANDTFRPTRVSSDCSCCYKIQIATISLQNETRKCQYDI